MTHDTAPYWKEDIEDLLARAHDVIVAPPARNDRLTAREAAYALAGVMSWIHHVSGVDVMQRAAASVARHDAAWKSDLARLPHDGGRVDKDVALIATVARGLLDLAGETNLRSAMSFWATETDPSVWQSLAA